MEFIAFSSKSMNFRFFISFFAKPKIFHFSRGARTLAPAVKILWNSLLFHRNQGFLRFSYAFCKNQRFFIFRGGARAVAPAVKILWNSFLVHRHPGFMRFSYAVFQNQRFSIFRGGLAHWPLRLKSYGIHCLFIEIQEFCVFHTLFGTTKYF